MCSEPLTRILMLLTTFLLVILAVQVANGNPMSWDFSAVTNSQASMYSLLKAFSNMGKAPLYFPASNSSTDYASIDWMNPCYERYYEVGAYYIAYWIVNGDMYCEALVNGNPNNYKPPFGQANLFRVEYQKTWCSNNK